MNFFSDVLKEAYLYEKLDDGKARCNVCPRRCVIAPGKRGFCRTRKNVDGKIYSLVYGMLSSEAVDPIEKKPLYNFWPGSWAYSVATIGCSFRCAHCQNWQISQADPSEDGASGTLDRRRPWGGQLRLRQVTPQELVSRVERSGAQCLAYTYNEPLIWLEYILDCSKLAHDRGIQNVLVSNGYSTPEAIDLLAPHLDAANVDVKAFSDQFYRDVCKVPSIKPVLDAVVQMKELGVFVELTTLLIPGLNDDPEELRALVAWVRDEVGVDTPVHFSAFHPDYEMRDRPRTSVATLEAAYSLAKEAGLQYVYLGNVRSSFGEHTTCPACGKAVIERAGYSLLSVALTEDNKCSFCGAQVNVRGPVTAERRSRF
ncbi:MAG: AmmeMemoRadiSam system radical SAM enzyme [Promethearchaeota archaeon]